MLTIRSLGFLPCCPFLGQDVSDFPPELIQAYSREYLVSIYNTVTNFWSEFKSVMKSKSYAYDQAIKYYVDSIARSESWRNWQKQQTIKTMGARTDYPPELVAVFPKDFLQQYPAQTYWGQITSLMNKGYSYDLAITYITTQVKGSQALKQWQAEQQVKKLTPGLTIPAMNPYVPQHIVKYTELMVEAAKQPSVTAIQDLLETAQRTLRGVQALDPSTYRDVAAMTAEKTAGINLWQAVINGYNEIIRQKGGPVATVKAETSDYPPEILSAFGRTLLEKYYSVFNPQSLWATLNNLISQGKSRSEAVSLMVANMRTAFAAYESREQKAVAQRQQRLIEEQEYEAKRKAEIEARRQAEAQRVAAWEKYLAEEQKKARETPFPAPVAYKPSAAPQAPQPAVVPTAPAITITPVVVKPFIITPAAPAPSPPKPVITTPSPKPAPAPPPPPKLKGILDFGFSIADLKYKIENRKSKIYPGLSQVITSSDRYLEEMLREISQVKDPVERARMEANARYLAEQKRQTDVMRAKEAFWAEAKMVPGIVSMAEVAYGGQDIPYWDDYSSGRMTANQVILKIRADYAKWLEGQKLTRAKEEVEREKEWAQKVYKPAAPAAPAIAPAKERIIGDAVSSALARLLGAVVRPPVAVDEAIYSQIVTYAHQEALNKGAYNTSKMDIQNALTSRGYTVRYRYAEPARVTTIPAPPTPTSPKPAPKPQRVLPARQTPPPPPLPKGVTREVIIAQSLDTALRTTNLYSPGMVADQLFNMAVNVALGIARNTPSPYTFSTTDFESALLSRGYRTPKKPLSLAAIARGAVALTQRFLVPSVQVNAAEPIRVQPQQPAQQPIRQPTRQTQQWETVSGQARYQGRDPAIVKGGEQTYSYTYKRPR